jgi:hypothetical protein
MKKIFLYFLLYLVPFLGVSQLKKVVYKDNSGFSHQQGFINQLGNKDSCWVYYDDSGKISSIANYKNGYFVALTDNQTHPKNRLNTVNKVHQTARKLNIKNYYIGYWMDKKTNTEYIDLSIHIKKLSDAKKIGYQYNQKAIFSCKKLDSIYL